MTSNSTLFITFQPHTSPSNVTLADVSASFVIGSGTIIPTPSLFLSSVLSLPQLSFNLISMSKLIRTLNCCISFFPDYCLFHDLTMKKIIGKGHESRGLYILDTQIPRSIACSRVVTAFEAHCWFDHPSLFVLKKLCPMFQKLSSLDCESCKFSKHHRLSLRRRVNKQASDSFELIHLDV